MYKAMQDAPDIKKNVAEASRIDEESLQYIDRTVAGKTLGTNPAVSHVYLAVSAEVGRRLAGRASDGTPGWAHVLGWSTFVPSGPRILDPGR